MRFDRYPLRTGNRRGPTPRRLAAARRALKRQADDVALFPELAPTETPEERVARFDADTDKAVASWRDLEAKHWRRARAQFRALTTEQQARVSQAFWGNRFMPKNGTYLLETIRAETKP
jgi:hypothetical protein